MKGLEVQDGSKFLVIHQLHEVQAQFPRHSWRRYRVGGRVIDCALLWLAQCAEQTGQPKQGAIDHPSAHPVPAPGVPLRMVEVRPAMGCCQAVPPPAGC